MLHDCKIHSGLKLLVKCGMWNAEWKLWKDGVEWWVKCVMRKFVYVGDRWSIVNSCEWACCTLVVRFNGMKSEYVFVIDVPRVIF